MTAWHFPRDCFLFGFYFRFHATFQRLLTIKLFFFSLKISQIKFWEIFYEYDHAHLFVWVWVKHFDQRAVNLLCTEMHWGSTCDAWVHLWAFLFICGLQTYCRLRNFAKKVNGNRLKSGGGGRPQTSPSLNSRVRRRECTSPFGRKHKSAQMMQRQAPRPQLVLPVVRMERKS